MLQASNVAWRPPLPDTGFAPVPGGRLSYRTSGSGSALLLIHGDLGTSRMWDGQVGPLAERYRVIRYDRRGFGQSESEQVEFSPLADAAAVLAHLGEDTAHVVAQSRGAVIALDLAVDRPRMVRSLVLAAGSASGLQADAPAGVEPVPWDEWQRLYEAGRWPELSELTTRIWVDGWGQPPSRIPHLRETVSRWILDSYAAEKEEGLPKAVSPPAGTRLHEIDIPLLMFIGALDEPVGVINAQTVAREVRGARLVEFPDVAHMVHLERPDDFNRITLDFLAEVDRVGATRQSR